MECALPAINTLPEETRADLIARLKRIEGQARGIQKMFDDGRECASIIDQVASIKAAVNALSGEMLEAYAVHCLTNAAGLESPVREIEEAVRVIVRAGR
jgi:DNA-binding FrmR family transcriptional regulator